MKPGTKINVLNGATVWFPSVEPMNMGYISTLDRNIDGEVLTVYPYGIPNKIEFAHQIIVRSDLNWEEGKD